MDEAFRRKECRRQSRLERLGTNTPRCIMCGEDDSRCLELHHIAGRQFDDDLAIVCRNCHRRLSDAQKDHPKPQGNEPSFEERLEHFLRGLADLFELLMKKMREFADALAATTVSRD
jgi:hypothetical protein